MVQYKPDFKIISQEIIEMAERDQALRKKLLETVVGDWNEIEKMDRRHTARMREIIEQIGWPTISKVGKVASGKAWLLVQHATHDFKFQQKCLRLMKQTSTGEVDPGNIAYLEDRILVHAGHRQIYGTQFYTDQMGRLRPRPIRDRQNLDWRRKQMGLGSFAEYQKMGRKLFKKDKQ